MAALGPPITVSGVNFVDLPSTQAGLRNRPTYNPTQYSVEWANVVTTYLKRQLADIALPIAPRPGLNVKQAFKGVLSEAESRDNWISRFTYWCGLSMFPVLRPRFLLTRTHPVPSGIGRSHYSLRLLRPFYAEGLVDNRTFLSWLVQQMSTCNLAQAGFVARLADEYLDGMLVSRALTHPFIEACLAKFAEVR